MKEEEEKENCKGKSKDIKVDFLEYKPQHSLRILPETRRNSPSRNGRNSSIQNFQKG